MNRTINYSIEIRETLVKSEFVETKGPKQYRVHRESNPTFKDWHKGEENHLKEPVILNVPLRAELHINIWGMLNLVPKAARAASVLSRYAKPIFRGH